MAPDAEDGATFDYRIVAKRRGYEDRRLMPMLSSYSDHYLYPDLNDVPEKYREDWIDTATYDERVRFGLPLEESNTPIKRDRRVPDMTISRNQEERPIEQETELE